jgi:glycosyltransferase involved in cell wall biosynthesis
MSFQPGISIIVCTRNRAAALAQTLAALGGIAVPAGGAELIVVDNGSTDDTPDVVGRAGLANMEVRYVHEPRPGVSHARNTGLSSACGDLLLFTDDDVRPAKDWAEKLTAPLRDGRYDAVAGRIVLAPHLARPWIRPEYAVRLAVLNGLMEGEVEMFCANMGIRRSVLHKVPAFDPELGPGALGFGEDTLFSWQVALAGFRLGFVEQAVAVHHPDPSRLRRSAWLDSARKRGRTRAYLLHHWRHEALPFPRLCWLGLAAKLFLRRIIQPPGALHDEGCPLWEMGYLRGMAQYRHFLVERRRPRNYAKQGLVKLSAPTEAGG